MEILEKVYTEKESAGKAIINACTKMKSSDTVALRQYRGFSLTLSYTGANNEFRMTMKGALSHTVTLGADVFGNITHMDNMLNNLIANLEVTRSNLEDTKVQLENARTEMETPFAKEEELAQKTARLKELNILLNMDQSEQEKVNCCTRNELKETEMSQDRHCSYNGELEI